MISQLTKALNKCTRVSDCTVYAECTPTEYFLIKNYLNSDESWYDDYNLDRKNAGSCEQACNYFHTKREKASEFRQSEYFKPQGRKLLL